MHSNALSHQLLIECAHENQWLKKKFSTECTLCFELEIEMEGNKIE